MVDIGHVPGPGAGPSPTASAAAGAPDGLAASADEARDLLALAQEAGGFGVFEWSPPAGTVRLSSKLLSLQGLADFDERYDSWLAHVFHEDRSGLVDALDTAFAAHRREFVREFRVVLPADNSLRWLETRALVFYGAGDGPERVVGVCVDITERRHGLRQMQAFAERLEERVRERTVELEAEHDARRRAEDTLRQAQKMEAVGQLTGGVAHDFNNLLTIISGGLEIIDRMLPELPDQPATQRIARARDMSMKGVTRAATLTKRLLAFARRQPLSPQPIDANRLVSNLSDLLRRTIGEMIALETVMSGGLWMTHADPNQLEQALVNLAVNARDAMPNGGKLTIETQNSYLDDAYVRALAEPVQPGQYVMIAVADSGEGMDAATMERAFEPFFTTRGVGRGSGLGLSQVYGFVRQSAGHVRLYSEPGNGTTVKLYLPRYIGPELMADTQAQRDSVRAIGDECILVVEDDDALRAYTTELLAELGYRVLEAANGPEALHILEGSEHIDLLFTDIVMPGGMNGRQLADAAVRRRPGLRVLFTTGYTRNAIVHHGRLDPGVKVIGKPFTRDALASMVRTMLDSDGV
ncbi:MAG: ATP-binding protein [Acetobacteraceae bacterium]